MSSTIQWTTSIVAFLYIYVYVYLDLSSRLHLPNLKRVKFNYTNSFMGLYRVTSPREHSRKWKGLWSWSKVKEFLDPKGPNPSTWNNIFLFSCVIAVSIDPLFFYIPLINEEKKCFGIDNKLKNVALVLRSVTDVSYILHIIFQIRARCIVDGSGISKRNGCVANVLEIARRIP